MAWELRQRCTKNSCYSLTSPGENVKNIFQMFQAKTFIKLFISPGYVWAVLGLVKLEMWNMKIIEWIKDVGILQEL